MYKMVPKGRYGGILQTPYKRDPLILNKPVPKAQTGLTFMKPLEASVQSPQLQTQLDTSKLDPMSVAPETGGGLNAGVVSAGVGLASGIGTALIDSNSDTGTDAYGIEMPESSGSAVGKGALQGAASGAATGAMFGPWGAAIGGVVGGLGGALKGKLGNKQANKAYDTAFSKANKSFIKNQDAQKYQAMMGKDGINFGRKFNEITSDKKGLIPIFKVGGQLGEPNVIAKGKLHKENNNLGNGDKGIPVIDSDGTKKYELEKEEWITTSDVTSQLQTMAAKYNSSNDDSDLESLGQYVSEQFMSNTQDNSKRYGLGGKK